MDRFQLAIVVHRYKPHVEDIFLAQRYRERGGTALCASKTATFYVRLGSPRASEADRDAQRDTGQWSDLLARSTRFRFAAADSPATVWRPHATEC